MEYRTESGRLYKNAWIRNTTGNLSDSGKSSFTTNHYSEEELSSILDNQRLKDFHESKRNTNKTENSMTAYSEKMHRISLERNFVTSSQKNSSDAHRWSTRMHVGKPKEMPSADSRNGVHVEFRSTIHSTRSESELTKLNKIRNNEERRKISDSVLTRPYRNNDVNENRFSPVRSRKFGFVANKEKTRESNDSSSETTTDKLNKNADECKNGNESALSESLVEITPFPPYKESTFYQKRLRSSRQRFVQSEYIDRTEKISNKVRPKFNFNTRLGSFRFGKIPSWKQKAEEAKKCRWKRTRPPKPPPKPYHQLFRYSDAVRELMSGHESNSSDDGSDSLTKPVLTFWENNSTTVSVDEEKSDSWNSEGSDEKDGRRVRDSSPERKTVQFKLPKVKDSPRLVSNIQRHKQSNATSANFVSVKD